MDTQPDMPKEPPSRIPKEDLLLHPLRMRIILAAVGRKEVTAQQLVDDLPDIPQATLYRHINILAGAGILEVVRERRMRNTIEKTFALRQDRLSISQADLAGARPEVLMRQFTEFLGILMGYFGRLLARPEPVDLTKDHVLFNLLPFNLSESEAAGLMQSMGAAVAPYLKLEPSPERKRLVMGVVTVPDTPAPPRAAGPPAANGEATHGASAGGGQRPD